MNVNDFIEDLRLGGMPFADDEPDYCPVHAWAPQEETYHHVTCAAYAQKLGL
jgi:hypothetical protein